MSLLYSHDIRLHGSAGATRFTPRRVIRRIGLTFKAIHRAIAAAKIHRLRNELLLRGHADWAMTGDRRITTVGADAERYPRQPVILGDKWDY
jgi:hypothetical protein